MIFLGPTRSQNVPQMLGVGLPRTVCDFVRILNVIAIEFLPLTSREELSTKAPITGQVLRYVSTYNRDMTIDR